MLKIEEGKYYLNRNKELQGPVSYYGGLDSYIWEANSRYFDSEGYYLTEDLQSEFDLVLEIPLDPGYRFLSLGEQICEGDEYCCETRPITWHNTFDVGHTHTHTAMVYRRRVSAKDGQKLETIPELTLEVGKYYLNRLGNKVGPILLNLEEGSKENYKFCGGLHSYTKEGYWLDKEHSSRHDLISEAPNDAEEIPGHGENIYIPEPNLHQEARNTLLQLLSESNPPEIRLSAATFIVTEKL